MPNDAPFISAIHRLIAAGKTGDGVMEAQDSLVAETARLPLKNIVEWERRIRGETTASEAQAPTTRWRISRRPGRLLSWLDVGSSDGFRREQFLRAMSGGAPNPFFLVLAIRRLNDWVPQVRAAARERIPDLAEHSDPQCVDTENYVVTRDFLNNYQRRIEQLLSDEADA